MAGIQLSAQTYEQTFQKFTEKEALQSAQIGFWMADASTNKVLFAHNETRNFVPASVVKLFTTAAALQLLGSEFNYQTSVLYSGKLIDGVLNGNIKIIASGDPSLSSDKFISEIITHLNRKGIKKITGSLTIDESLFDNELPQSWSFEDLANHYGSAAHAFNFDKNIYQITFSQNTEGKACRILKTDNFIPYQFDNKVVAGKLGTGDNAYILGAPFSTERQIVGTIPPGSGTFTIKGSMHHPAAVFEKLLVQKLKDTGIEIQGKPTENSLIFYDTLLVYKSPQLSEIIQTTNQESINLYAEALLKTIAIKLGKKGNTQNGLEAIAAFWEGKEIHASQLKLKDGSGLSRMNLLSPEAVGKVLLEMKNNPAFTRSLAKAGESGTLKSVGSTKLKGRMLAKSGSSSGILNYAGYYTAPNGQKMAFAIFVNNFTDTHKSVRAAILSMLEEIL
jgi:serine-type D-Ala-D-Ala carboxypeptidase/endopeptidase (penicillin-binding protein 4)